MLATVPARHRLRDHLDNYRVARALALEGAALLDVLDRQTSRNHAELRVARATARRLCDELLPLTGALS